MGTAGIVCVAHPANEEELMVEKQKYSIPSFSKLRKPECPASKILLPEIMHREYLARGVLRFA